MKKVITYGTFDLFHSGHYNILKRAKELGDYLIVGVTSESFDIERGKLAVRDSLATRINNVEKTGFADEIIVEEFQGQKILDIKKYDIDIFVIGSDWFGKFDYLKQYCKVVYLNRTKNISSTQLRNELQNYNVGLIIEQNTSNEIIEEIKYVSGLNIKCVYCDNIKTAKKYSKNNQIGKYVDDLTSLINLVDIIYIDTSKNNNYKIIKKILMNNKHVVCNSPIAKNYLELQELLNIANKNKVVLLDVIKPSFLQSINQIFYIVESKYFGDLISAKLKFSLNKDNNLSNNICIYISLLIHKIFNNNNYKLTINKRLLVNGDYVEDIIIKFKDKIMIIQVDNSNDNDELCIICENGEIITEGDWWQCSSYKTKNYSKNTINRFSFNYEGNGYRYIFRELLIMIRENKIENPRLTYKELLKIKKIEEKIVDYEEKNNKYKKHSAY